MQHQRQAQSRHLNRPQKPHIHHGTGFCNQVAVADRYGQRHTEDFDADPAKPASWRNFGAANGTMGDLALHMINAVLALIGPMARLSADVATVHKTRPGAEGRETNDAIGQFMCRFADGALGHLSFSRVAAGRKMDYAYEITGTKRVIRFEGEDQNAPWPYRADDTQGLRGFRKILTGPEHPDYLSYAGYDPVAFMRRHIGRISYIHFKDIDPKVKAAAVAHRTGFYEACGQGIFCNLGQGDVDFPAVRQRPKIWC